MIKADVSKISDIEFIIEEVKNKFGRIDILFANVGISECPPIQGINEDFFNHMDINVNVNGVFFTFTKALPILEKDASVIFTSAIAHKLRCPRNPLYSATKAAVRNLARTLAADDEVLEKGICVNVISTGTIKTPLTIQDSSERAAAVDKYIEASVPIRR